MTEQVEQLVDKGAEVEIEKELVVTRQGEIGKQVELESLNLT